MEREELLHAASISCTCRICGLNTCCILMPRPDCDIRCQLRYAPQGITKNAGCTEDKGCSVAELLRLARDMALAHSLTRHNKPAAVAT